MSSKDVIEIYTDGCCFNNHQKENRLSGYGIYYGENDIRNVSEPIINGGNNNNNNNKLTNNRAEMIAIIKACEINTNNNIIIYTDSKLCSNIINIWMYKWKKNNWKKSNKKNILNLDLIKEIYDIITINMIDNKPKIKWIKRDSHKGNTEADRLSKEGALKNQ